MTITVTDIIISETGKKINEVISHKKVNFKIKKSELSDIRTSIQLNHRLANNHDIIVSLGYKEN